MKRKKIWLSVLAGLLVLLLLYTGSYVILSARGCYEPAGIGLGGVKWYAWAPHGFVEGYRWKRCPMLIYAPLLCLDRWLWHPPGNPPPGGYPVNEVKREDIWKVYKAHGFFDQKESPERQAREPK
jgi:hypothetical protein